MIRNHPIINLTKRGHCNAGVCLCVWSKVKVNWCQNILKTNVTRITFEISDTTEKF